MIPLLQSSNDPFYRYKMPELACTQESNRTVLLNLDAVAKTLHREPDHILRYMDDSLGCTHFVEPGRYSLIGKFECKRLQQLIYDFIEKFVLCLECNNPETKFIDDNILKRRCNSCGATVTQPFHKINSAIKRSLSSLTNEDLRYENNKSEGTEFSITPEKVNEEREEGAFKLFSTYIKPSELKQHIHELNEYPQFVVMDALEDMLEQNGKEEKTGAFLKVLCSNGWSVDAVEEYFSRPRKDKKRSPLIKKNAAYFLDTYEEK